jgi:hypothetical protein
MKQVFASLKLAKESLQEYTNAAQCDCCVYRVRYGRNHTEEYILKRMDEVLDPASKNVIMKSLYKR